VGRLERDSRGESLESATVQQRKSLRPVRVGHNNRAGVGMDTPGIAPPPLPSLGPSLQPIGCARQYRNRRLTAVLETLSTPPPLQNSSSKQLC